MLTIRVVSVDLCRTRPQAQENQFGDNQRPLNLHLNDTIQADFKTGFSDSAVDWLTSIKDQDLV